MSSQKVTPQKYEDEDRIDRIWHVIESHRPQSDVYALKYGSIILGVPTFISSTIIQRYCNKRFKIGTRSFFMYAPMMIPAIAAGLTHRKIIEEKVLRETIDCPGCTEFVCGALQLFTGPLWTFILSPLSASMISSLRKTIYVPPIDKYPMETVRFAVKKLRGFGPTGLAICLGNFAFALVLTNLEIKQYTNLKLCMLARLSQFDSSVSPAEFFDTES